MTSIVVVEDEFITATDIEHQLKDMGYTVPAIVDNGEDAIRKAGELAPDLFLMDITLVGEMTGIEAAGRIRDLYHIPVIFLTAHSEHAMVERALSSNPFGYIVKPFDPPNLRAGIEMALYKHGMEEKLLESERTIRSLLNAVPDALLLLDGNRRVVTLNEPMTRVLGASRIGAPIDEPAGGGDDWIPRNEIATLYETGIPASCETRVRDHWYEISLFPMKDEAGRISRVAIQSHDITDYKRLEEEMKREGVTRIEKNMEQFMILNDRIRNPLQAIRGYLELGGEGPYRARIEEQVEIIDRLVDQLDRGWVESEKVRSFLIRHYRHGLQGREEGIAEGAGRGAGPVSRLAGRGGP